MIHHFDKQAILTDSSLPGIEQERNLRVLYHFIKFEKQTGPQVERNAKVTWLNYT